VDSPWAISAEAISYAYPNGVEALADLSFCAARGEIVAVLGPNGAGKTTLMKVLLRLLRPKSGHVRIGAADIADLSPAELYRHVGIVLQNPADQLFGASVAEDVAFGPRNLGLSGAELDGRVAESLAAVDAAALAERPIHRLSYGEQKRVCLAGVLAM
jgi:cobalt/nickel transport system ATP-binding protein